MGIKPTKPPFDADAAEEYLTSLCVWFRDEANRIFKEDNLGRPGPNPIYSAEYQKLLGKEIAMREVLEYFSKFDLTTVAPRMWRPGSKPPESEKPVLAAYHFDHGEPTMEFFSVLTYFAFDPEPHWQHQSTGVIVDRWMPIPDKKWRMTKNEHRNQHRPV
jgi:hypothetical protein